MDKRRVLLLSVQSLLSESLENVLSQVEDVELIGPWKLDGHALDRLAERAPDVVLVAEEAEECDNTASFTSQILERYPELPVVRVALGQSVVRLYTSQALPARTADLLETIRSLPARS